MVGELASGRDRAGARTTTATGRTPPGMITPAAQAAASSADGDPPVRQSAPVSPRPWRNPLRRTIFSPVTTARGHRPASPGHSRATDMASSPDSCRAVRALTSDRSATLSSWRPRSPPPGRRNSSKALHQMLDRRARRVLPRPSGTEKCSASDLECRTTPARRRLKEKWWNADSTRDSRANRESGVSGGPGDANLPRRGSRASLAR